MPLIVLFLANLKQIALLSSISMIQYDWKEVSPFPVFLTHVVA